MNQCELWILRMMNGKFFSFLSFTFSQDENAQLIEQINLRFDVVNFTHKTNFAYEWTHLTLRTK